MKTLLASLACLLVLLSLAACGDDDDEATQTPSDGTPAATSPGATTQQSVCLDNPDPADADVNNVTAPADFDQVTSPVEVTGNIAAFEAVFQITLFDAQGNKITDQPAMSNEGQTLAPFSASVLFSVHEPTPACIWVYEISNADGVTPTNVVQVPVTLLP